jgi:hypothetical protein
MTTETKNAFNHLKEIIQQSNPNPRYGVIVSKETRAYLTEVNKNNLTSKLSKAARDVRVQYRDNLEANSARNWSACK